MKITITDGSSFINVEVEAGQTVEDVKALLEAETNVPMQQLELFFESQPLNDSHSLAHYKVAEGGLLYYRVTPNRPQPAARPGNRGGIAAMIKNFDKQVKSVKDQGYEFNHRRVEEFEGQAKKIIDELGSDPMRLLELEEEQPQMVAAIRERDVRRVAELMHRNNEEHIRKLKEKERRFVELSKDPMNPEYQKLLEERIRQENVDKNLEFANEYIPEVFGHITMLYIKASINKQPIHAFVDSGAQSTIMSQSLAERCGLMRLVDKRQAGRAVGVGSCKILGKIHAAEIEIEGKFLTCSFTVIENNSVEFLLGLDMLRRFNCVMDLGRNTLNFQNGLIETQFLSDAEVNKFKNPVVSQEEAEVKVKKITDMGFGRGEALEALRSCGYNEEVAGNMLMQRKYGGK